MKKLLHYLIITIIVFGVTNCSSTFFSLKPDEESSLELGRKIIEKETDKVYSSLSFEDQTGNDYAFHLYVYNKDDEMIIVDPKDIFFKIYDENRQPISSKKYNAYNPGRRN